MNALPPSFVAQLPLEAPELHFVPDHGRGQVIDTRSSRSVWVLGRWVDRHDRTLFVAVIPVDAATFRRPEELSE